MSTMADMSPQEQMDFLAGGGIFHQSGATIAESVIHPGIYVIVREENGRVITNSAPTILEMMRLSTQGSFPMEGWVAGEAGEAWDKAVEVTFSRPEVNEHLSSKAKPTNTATPPGVSP